jgi:hypothetical protein
MKVRKLLKHNINKNLAIVFEDIHETQVIFKGSIPLEYFDREVKRWTVDGIYEMRMPQMTIWLKEKDDGQ